MKKNRHIFAIFALVAAAALVFSCIDFKEILWPKDPKANDTFEIKLKVHLEPQTERTGRFVLAFVVPKKWKVAETIQAKYSATQVQVKGQLVTITDEPMTLAGDYTEPTTGMPYASAMLSKYGVLGNTGPVEWIVLRGSTVIDVNGGGAHPDTNADVTISFKTGPTNIKFFSAFATCLDDNGFNDANAGEYIISYDLDKGQPEIIEVTGGSGYDDYTILHFVSTTPQTFRFGDYVSIDFASAITDSKGQVVRTELYGEDQVYLNGVCTLKDGSEHQGQKVLMTRTGDETYFKYIYPKSYFGVGENAEIEAVRVWFTNADGTKTAKGDDGDGYDVYQASE